MKRTKKSLAITAFLVLAGSGLATTGQAAAAEPATSRPETVSSTTSKADATYYFHTVWSTGADCANRGQRGVSNREWSDWICLKDSAHSSTYRWSLYIR